MSIESQIFLQFVLTAFTAVGASFFTAWFALRRFYSEKWWEKKYEGYSSVLESLHYIVRHFDEEMTATAGGREIPDDRKQKLREKYRDADDELVKRMDIGQFVISDAAVAVLATFQNELGTAGNTTDWVDYLDGGGVASRKALKQMRDIAKRDLEHS